MAFLLHFFCPGFIESLDACLVSFIISETVYLFCQYLVNKTLHKYFTWFSVLSVKKNIEYLSDNTYGINFGN